MQLERGTDEEIRIISDRLHSRRLFVFDRLILPERTTFISYANHHPTRPTRSLQGSEAPLS